MTIKGDRRSVDVRSVAVRSVDRRRSTDRTATGHSGETRVADTLLNNGWQIIDRNWRTRRGEIDIIALEEDSLVFIEVKTWPRGTFDDLEMVIGRSKQKRMLETAKCFLDSHRQYNGMYVRFDVVFVSSDPQKGELLEYRHLKDAFSERV